MMRVTVKYSCGYGTHSDELEFEDGTPDEEIEAEVADFAQERFEWSWRRADGE